MVIIMESPWRYMMEAQPGPFKGTTGKEKSLQQLHKELVQAQYRFGGPCRNLVIFFLPLTTSLVSEISKKSGKFFSFFDVSSSFTYYSGSGESQKEEN